jgi:hypothetical protein
MNSPPLPSPLPSPLAETREALRRTLLPPLVLDPGRSGEAFPRSTIMKWLVRRDHTLLWSISPLIATYLLPRLGARRTLALASSLLNVARPFLSARALWAAARRWPHSGHADPRD